MRLRRDKGPEMRLRVWDGCSSVPRHGWIKLLRPSLLTVVARTVIGCDHRSVTVDDAGSCCRWKKVTLVSGLRRMRNSVLLVTLGRTARSSLPRRVAETTCGADGCGWDCSLCSE